MACTGYGRGTLRPASSACAPTSSTYIHCGDGLGAPCRDMYATACEEKSDMQNLNNRLANHLEKLRGLQQQPNIDPALYRNAMQSLEAEMNKMKSGYEAEIDRLRRALEDCCREKNMYAINANQCGTNLSDLQARVNSLQNQLQKALADNQGLCSQLANRDKELADLRACLKGHQDELGFIKPDYSKLKQEVEDLNRRLGCELKSKSDEDCRLRGMLDKCSFDSNNKDKQVRDLQDRLKATNDIISGLEAKVRQLSNRDDSQMNSLLQRMRDDTMADMRKQQQATENSLNQSLQQLRCQIDTDARDKDALGRERARLQDLIQQLQAKISELEGRLTACCNENAQLKADLERERTCSQQEIRNLEQKLHELHAQMISKVKECAQARDQQLSLKAEIGNYNMLINAADAKLSQQPAPPTSAPPSYTTVRRATSVPPAPACNSYSAYCPPLKPAQVLGAALGPSGDACCNTCSRGGPCDSGKPSMARSGYDQFAQRPRTAWGNQRISADFVPASTNFSRQSTTATRTYSTRPW